MKHVSVEIIHKCPNNCVHCSSYSGPNCTMKLDYDIMCNVIDDIQKMHGEVLSISGGEPFLHENLLEFVEYAKNKGIKVYIYTSGIMYTDESEREVTALHIEMLEKLKQIHVDKIIYDIPAIDESVYDKFMGTCGYQKYAFESIERTKTLGIYTEIHVVPTKININQIDKIISFSQKYKIDRVSFLGLVPHGRARKNRKFLYLNSEENTYLKNKLHGMEGDMIRVGIPLQVVESEYHCFAGADKLCVRYDGKVFGCEAFKYITLLDEQKNEILVDSIYEKTLWEIYCNSLHLKKEREFAEMRMNANHCGEKCPVQQIMRQLENQLEDLENKEYLSLG